MPADLERLYTTAEAAGIVRESERTVRTKCAAGLIKPVEVKGYNRDGRPTGYLIPESTLAAYRRLRRYAA